MTKGGRDSMEDTVKKFPINKPFKNLPKNFSKIFKKFFQNSLKKIPLNNNHPL